MVFSKSTLLLLATLLNGAQLSVDASNIEQVAADVALAKKELTEALVEE